MKAAVFKLVLWAMAMLAGLAVLTQTRFVADMSFFLPSSPTAEQRLLVDQMKDGSVSRLLMVAIEGGSDDQRAQASRDLRQALTASDLYASVQNGELDGLSAERDFLLRFRYHLSPRVAPGRFEVAGLRDAVANAIDLVSSPMGQLFKPYVLRDPTAELVEVLTGMQAGGEPPTRHGVWSSPDGERALLLAQTRAGGADTDGQAQAIAAVQDTFARLQARPALSGLRLVLSGPGMFAVQARATVRDAIERISLISGIGIGLLLLVICRSPRMLALGMLPVVSGAIVAAAVVALAYGSIHGITLGFGAALIGEGVDYAIYYFVQAGRVGVQGWRERFWPTIRLGVLTSVAGFSVLMLAGFPGLAQLGLYAVTGVVVAAVVTRHVLPVLAGERLQVPPPGALARTTQGWLSQAAVLRWPLVVAALVALGYLAFQGPRLWSTNLSALSTVSAEEAQVDARLRADIGAPDARYLVLLSGADREAVLQAAEQTGQRLDALVAQGLIGGYDNPARFLPSERTQAARLAALPPREVLAPALAQALVDAPLSASRLGGFLDDVQAARQAGPLTRADLDGTAMAMAVDALMNRTPDGRWNAVLPLRPPHDAAETEVPVERLGQALAGTGAVLVDLKGEFEGIYASYLDQAMGLSLGGVLAVIALLAFTLRSLRRLARVVTPLLLAVALVAATMHATGTPLHLMHLVGLLLIVAIGSNYALFFDQVQEEGGLTPDLWLSMSVAVLTTVIGFGALAVSHVPVLRAMGVTVAPGVLLTLLLSAAFMPPPRGGQTA